MSAGRACPVCRRRIPPGVEHQCPVRRPATLRPPPAPIDAAYRRAAVAAHVAEHGHVCPGWGRPPHDALDLTADHVTARSNPAGPGETGDLAVLCRSCNARKGAASTGPPGRYRPPAP